MADNLSSEEALAHLRAKLTGERPEGLSDEGWERFQKAQRLSLFKRELTTLINQHGLENESSTPDFILAQVMVEALETFETAVRRRAVWFGDPVDKLGTKLGLTKEVENATQDDWVPANDDFDGAPASDEGPWF